MNILRNLAKIVIGKTSEMGERIIDDNALVILEQNIRDAKSALSKAKVSLSEIMAQKTLVEQKVAELDKSISERREKGKELYKRDPVANKAILGEIAQKIESLSALKSQETTRLNQLTENVSVLRADIEKMASKVTSMENQVSALKATEAVQSAQAKIFGDSAAASGSLSSAEEALQRVQNKQKARAARTAATIELSEVGTDASLDRKIAEALGKPAGSGTEDGEDKLKDMFGS